VMDYPQSFDIRTPDGRGEAIKNAQGDCWSVSLPAIDFWFYGSVAEMKKEVAKRLAQGSCHPAVEFEVAVSCRHPDYVIKDRGDGEQRPHCSACGEEMQL